MAEFLDVVLSVDGNHVELHFEDERGTPISVPLVQAEGGETDRGRQRYTLSRWRIQHDTVGKL